MFRVETTNLTSGHLQIDIADVRLVVHWGAPRNHLWYWQEVGRAGRDGKPSLAFVYPYGRSLVVVRGAVQNADVLHTTSYFGIIEAVVDVNMRCQHVTDGCLPFKPNK
ncbi:hypothetical protein DPMN_180157 [Dreissena polymorpha]|uniref:Uncharacterized protein n=1 Tax=Dreissena polymorpha TaxID=45954 RepID=A0A9D4IMZ8_DREPO|nr:hypothetical protein DPMN_180157 [Dreissena polymorpha]